MKNQHFRFLAPTSPHIYPSHLPSKVFRLQFSLSGHFFHEFSENVLPAHIGSAILNIDTKHFQSPLFGPRSDPNRTHFSYDFQPYRSVARSFPLLSPPCLSSWTSKNLAFVCILATGGFLGRLYWYIRLNFDAIFMYPTPSWWYFDVSDIILSPFWCMPCPCGQFLM